MATYTAGPSTLRFSNRADPVQPGEIFEHDFSADGPEGEHGPSREAALIAAGAIVPVVAPTSAALRPSGSAPVASTVSPASAASPVVQSVPSSDSRRGPVTEE